MPAFRSARTVATEVAYPIAAFRELNMRPTVAEAPGGGRLPLSESQYLMSVIGEATGWRHPWHGREPRHHIDIEIDDRFIGDWIEYGMAEINSYLAKHLRFARWCEAAGGRACRALR